MGELYCKSVIKNKTNLNKNVPLSLTICRDFSRPGKHLLRFRVNVLRPALKTRKRKNLRAVK